MSKLNVSNLVELTSVVDTGVRAVRTGVRVSQDPPVKKAAHQFLDDAAQATRSGGELVNEVRASYLRHREV